ncbi:hypothetical protein LCGC14_0488490 [marine sediment metagenome]|uniref:Uncharacterized protein n=1 Tax=marine sediment metagenome TaxID=412755 RepID=A0A0F9SQF0_9ZZZZ
MRQECEECVQQLKRSGIDPRYPEWDYRTHRLMPPSCNGCIQFPLRDKFENDVRKVVEEMQPEARVVHQKTYIVPKDWDKLNQLDFKFRHLDKKVDKLMSSRTGTFGTKYTIRE